MTPEAAAKRYPSFIIQNPDDGVLEFYCDNQMLSTFRKCQGAFQEQFLSQENATLVPRGRSWSLEFGQYLHKCLEYFYQGQRDNWEGRFSIAPCVVGSGIQQDMISFLQICSDLWKTFDLDYYMAEENKIHIGKNAQALGGHDGALTLFSQYYKTHFRQERFKFVGWELSFGRGKEVPIWDTYYNDVSKDRFRAYYCGRIDLIVDDSEIIGPMDHKTTAYFDGTEREKFKPDDGIQGYCYAVQQMLGSTLIDSVKKSNATVINHISVRPPANGGERFKRSYIQYTPAEMNVWLKRQQSTFIALYDLVINERAPMWNTSLCNMWFYSSKCPYKALHEVAPAFREGIIKTFYDIKPAWNYERV